MFVEALARLNKKLMDEQSDITGTNTTSSAGHKPVF